MHVDGSQRAKVELPRASLRQTLLDSKIGRLGRGVSDEGSSRPGTGGLEDLKDDTSRSSDSMQNGSVR